MKIPASIKSLRPKKKWQKVVLTIVIILIIIVAGRMIIAGGGNDDEVSQREKVVEIARVYDIANSTTELPVVGKAESQSEAILRSESSGQISRVTKKLGDDVYSGEFIAEINNSSQRAEVLRAQGALDAAKANLIKAQSSGTQAGNLIKTSIFNSYTTSLDAVKNKVDQFIDRPDSAHPEMNTLVGGGDNSYYKRLEIENKRVIVGDILESWETSAYSVGDVDSAQELEARYLEAKNNLEEIRNFLILVSQTVNSTESGDSLPQTTVDKYKSDVASAVSSVSSNLNSLISAYSSYSSQINLGGEGQDILAAKAQVTQAQAGLYSAQASLEKTIIRSPITGKINAINIKQGDVVSNLEEVGEVIGSGELEIVAFINDEDRESVKIGSRVVVEGGYEAEVTRIAPSVNSTTQKVEIRISLGEGTDITNGQSVSISIKRDIEKGRTDLIAVPITAVKITGSSSAVFVVNSENIVESKEIKTGNILGDRIVIEEGLDLNDIIIVDARGLKVGDSVVIR